MFSWNASGTTGSLFYPPLFAVQRKEALLGESREILAGDIAPGRSYVPNYEYTPFVAKFSKMCVGWGWEGELARSLQEIALGRFKRSMGGIPPVHDYVSWYGSPRLKQVREKGLDSTS